MKRTQLGLFAFYLSIAPVANASSVVGILNGKESSKETAAQLQVLTNLQQEMTYKFNEIESELAAGNSEKALTVAKGVLDTVKIKTGIDPKNKIQEKFLIATKFPANANSIDDLDDEQKELVIRTISGYRGGLYLDIMNLSKRTTLLYIKAFQAQLEKSGGLTKSDKNKIRIDLVKASLIPMPVIDKSAKKITVFDEDVANEDHTYLFNRELKMFLIQNKNLEISEEIFETNRKNLKNEFLGKYNGDKLLDMNSAFKCMKDAYKLSNSYQIYHASSSCFYKFEKLTINIEQCYELANKIDDRYSDNSKEQARMFCFNKFNK